MPRVTTSPSGQRLVILLLAVMLVAASCTGDDGSESGDGPPGASSAGSDGAADGGGLVGWNPCYEALLDERDFGDWEGDVPPDVECATLQVPMDADDPGGEQIELAMARLPATGANPIGPLFFNPGGPGVSGVEEAVTTDWPDEVRASFDVIGFDPRGVGGSTPLECGLDVDEPATLTSADHLAYAEAVASDCEEVHGSYLEHLGTDAVVEDLETMRAAVGAEQLTYVGVSYGTLLGVMYADRYPQHVRAMALEGNVDPSLDLAEMVVQMGRAQDSALDAFFAWCGASDECLLADLGDPAEVFDATMLALLAEPMTVEGIQLGVVDVADMVVGALYGGEQYYEEIDFALTMAATGDVRGLLLASELLDGAVGPDVFDDADLMAAVVDEVLDELDAAAALEATNEDVALLAVNCADYQVDWTDDGTELFEQVMAASPRVGFAVVALGWQCVAWPGADATTLGPVEAEGAPTILLLNGLYDPATPFEAAEALAEQLDDAVLVTYQGGWHGISLSGTNRCIDAVLISYLVTLDVPAPGSSCTIE